MRFRAKLARILGATAVTVVAIILIVFVFVQFQQHLLRHRAERLLADFHSLEMNRAEWPETHKVIEKWQHWGYSQGDCSPAHCAFVIDVADTLSIHLFKHPNHAIDWIYKLHAMNGLSRLGMRAGSLRVRFLVEDGKLVSKEVEVWSDVDWAGSSDYPVGVAVRMRNNFSEERLNSFYESGIAKHPNYIVTRPSGCTICMLGWVYFTPDISKSEIDRLTNFRLDCFTHPDLCQYPGDLLPSIAQYHLYEEHEPDFPPQNVCSVSAAARARDSKFVAVVDVISQRIINKGERQDAFEAAEEGLVRVVTVLKGSLNWTTAERIAIFPFRGEKDAYEMTGPQMLIPGKRYILFLDDAEPTEGLIPVDLCDVVADSEAARADTIKGIAKDRSIDIPQLSSW